jgi:protein-disulfide isomerase
MATSLSADDAVNCRQTDEIMAELRQLRRLIDNQGKQLSVNGRLQAQTAAIEVGQAPHLGSIDAPLTIVEFTDFQCPYCNRFFDETFPSIKKNYIDSGKVRFYSMDLPLDMHPNALRAAEAGRCAGEQGKFWLMHDHMQGNPTRLDMADLLGYAEGISIDVPAFRQCIENGKYKGVIKQEVRDATGKGARGTPAFVIGKSTPTGVEGELLIGTQPYGVLDEKLKNLINPQGH